LRLRSKSVSANLLRKQKTPDWAAENGMAYGLCMLKETWVRLKELMATEPS
jgi:hypothetical protein